MVLHYPNQQLMISIEYAINTDMFIQQIYFEIIKQNGYHLPFDCFNALINGITVLLIWVFPTSTWLQYFQMFHLSRNVSPLSKIILNSTLNSIRTFSSIVKPVNPTSLLSYGFSEQTPEGQGKTKQSKQIVCDFGLFEDPNYHIDTVIILNNQLNYNLLSRSLKLTDNIVLADGGANHIYNLQQYRNSEKIRALVGDFDGIKPEILDYYNYQLKIPVHFCSNLDTNDFAKSLEFCLQQKWKRIFAFGAFGGRMDQTLACMHYCERYFKEEPEFQITMFGQSNLMYFVKPHETHKIKCNTKFVSKFGCGIISFGLVEHVETEGFKYNLGQEQKYKKIEWGEFISSSNKMVEEECMIKGDDNLFFVVNYSREMLA